jgi:multiple antibiotic resistance protein
MLDWNDYLRMLTGLIAIVSPLGTVPLFLNLTENVQAQRKHIARTSALAVASILAVSVLAGSRILNLFNISIEGFQVAGGILLLSIAFEMLQARTSRTRRTPEEDEEAANSSAIGVVPLALPLLAGPGAISTAILFSQQSEAITHKAMLIALCVLVSLLVWLCFHLAPRIGKHLSQTSMNISSRVMGLILAAMAIEFIVGGIKTLLPGLG